MCFVCMPGAHREGDVGSPGIILLYHLREPPCDTGNQSQVLCKSSQFSQRPKHLSLQPLQFCFVVLTNFQLTWGRSSPLACAPSRMFSWWSSGLVALLRHSRNSEPVCGKCLGLSSPWAVGSLDYPPLAQILAPSQIIADLHHQAVQF